jgi:hypothetical protein
VLEDRQPPSIASAVGAARIIRVDLPKLLLRKRPVHRARRLFFERCERYMQTSGASRCGIAQVRLFKCVCCDAFHWNDV